MVWFYCGFYEEKKKSCEFFLISWNYFLQTWEITFPHYTPEHIVPLIFVLCPSLFHLWAQEAASRLPRCGWDISYYFEDVIDVSDIDWICRGSGEDLERQQHRLPCRFLLPSTSSSEDFLVPGITLARKGEKYFWASSRFNINKTDQGQVNPARCPCPLWPVAPAGSRCPCSKTLFFLLLSGLASRAVWFFLCFFLLEWAEQPFGAFPGVWGVQTELGGYVRAGEKL